MTPGPFSGRRNCREIVPFVPNWTRIGQHAVRSTSAGPRVKSIAHRTVRRARDTFEKLMAFIETLKARERDD